MTPSQPPSKRMSPGDIAVGQFVTVLEWEPIVHEPLGMDIAMGMTQTVVTQDNSYKGDVLRVTAVDLPFIVTEQEYGYSHGPIDLDTRRVSLMELSPAYVVASGRGRKSNHVAGDSK